MQKKISVVTLVRNREEQLVNLIRGLTLSELLPTELVIVRMNEAARADLPKAPFPIKQVELKNEEDKIPLAQARNRAARAAENEIILFLDVDCIPGKNLTRDMYDFQQESPGLIMSDVRYLHKGGTEAGLTREQLRAHSVPHPRRPIVPPRALLREENYTLFWSLCFSISRSHFEQIGGFDEDFRGYGAEDTDFAFSARDRGIAFYLSGTDCYHQYHPVYRPPLNNFHTIIHNARVFKEKRKRWAMESWLTEFDELGYINWSEEKADIDLLREPTRQETEAVFSDTGKGF